MSYCHNEAPYTQIDPAFRLYMIRKAILERGNIFHLWAEMVSILTASQRLGVARRH